MRNASVSITELPPSPDAERHSRMIKYTIAMAIRMVCIGLCLVVPGWWLLIPAAGAVVLPYIAVVLANSVRPRLVKAVGRPGTVVLDDRDAR